jgi:hypothetical protein
MKTPKWIVALALAFCFIARPGYPDDSYDYKGVAKWENAVWPEKAAGRYSIMGEKSLYSIWGKGGWPGLEGEGGRAGKYSIWGEGGWPGLDVEQRFIPPALTLYEGEHALFEDFVVSARTSHRGQAALQHHL